jgi:hypothetical protein
MTINLATSSIRLMYKPKVSHSVMVVAQPEISLHVVSKTDAGARRSTIVKRQVDSE